ncbi:MAG: hypothetical protein OEX22_02520 [Cyclobacteriaceae bacterium]|nr:hypothetical protein [Cyclobacteriaceae bacterium]
MYTKFKYITILIVIVMGCTTENVSPEDEASLGLDYFPLEVGRYVEYAVEQTIYDVFGEASSVFQLKTVIADSFVTNDYITYVLRSYNRNSDVEPWQLVAVWGVNVFDNTLIVQQGNISFSKLKFPVKEGSTWDGNAYNLLEEDEYEMKNVNQSYTLLANSFPETVTVIQHENLDVLVETDYRTEVYAKEVGLIYQEIQQIMYCTQVDCFSQQIIDEGIIYKQTIITYGKE